MSWLRGSSIKKSQFYVWYLGSKESDGLRGDDCILPVMRQLLKESFRRPPNKVTVQVSGKGLKLIQTVPTMSKSGKLKMEIMKFQIPANSVTYSMIGPAPFHDVVAVILLVFNPEMKCPVHVHVYRCDGPDTAAIMNANIQVLLSRPETQKHIADLERRLFINGLLLPRRKPPPAREGRSTNVQLPSRHLERPVHYSPPASQDYAGLTSDDDDDSDDPSTNLQRSLFKELKDKLKAKKDRREKMHFFGNYKTPRSITNNYALDSNLLIGGSPKLHRREYSMWDLRDRQAPQGRTDDGGNTSSTSGLGSEISSSAIYEKNRRGRMRYSIAEFPSWMTEDDTTAPCKTSHHAQLAAGSPPAREPEMKLRMFGDTILPKEKQVLKKELGPQLRAKLDSGVGGMAHARPARAHHFRSMDNLHMEAESDRVRLNPHGGSKPSLFPKSQLTDPFGHKYDRSANVDSFWKSKAKRASSWYLNHDPSLIKSAG
uniref:PID domain-containing protein n=1 Tax=Plectus sambesii TaxID=2011161 RepID=A0A914UVJ6_9BILA